MIRRAKREIQGWKQEFNALWSRLTTFHRTALGIFIAVLMVWCARHTTLDPLRNQADEAAEKLTTAGVPVRVPAPADDNEVQELQLRIENMERALNGAREALKRAMAEKPPLGARDKSRAVAETNRLITDAGLRIASLAETPNVESAVEEALSSSQHCYVLEGAFAGVHRFLYSMNSFPWPCRLTGLDIAVAGGADGAGRHCNGTPLVQFTFSHRLYYYDNESAE